MFLSFSVFCFLNGMAQFSAVEKTGRTLIVAHRGASALAPENTLSAFDAAVSLGADYIEVDIQMTKDGKLVAMHDVTVDRTTNGTGRVKNFTYTEIASLDAGSWFGPWFKGQRVPSLDAILDRYSGRTGILIELKHPSIYPDMEEELAKTLFSRISSSEPPPNIIVQSFDKQSIQEFHQLLPAVPTGLIVAASEFPVGDDLFAIEGFTSFITPQSTLVDASFMKQAKERNLNVFSWTVSDPGTARTLRNLNVNGIITNYPVKEYHYSNEVHQRVSFMISAITFLVMLVLKK
ncbi:glycerophosphodiester phosphodiesterase family protein [Bacillus sp. P14.5]|uniref:glycerophosphodiester phosphodiesterase n=1 Tax=Bacillus sp. P14.5 TaxID=1983400 RepID=UPI0013B061FB|nr:glycerophosphodiester phosphodiesterase family protein [Bacillus sp. P14.5]